jgi:hypothetical protein
MLTRFLTLLFIALIGVSCSEPTEPVPAHSVIPGAGSTFSYRSKILSIDTVYTYKVLQTGARYEGRDNVSITDGLGYIDYVSNGDIARLWNRDLWQTYPMGSMQDVNYFTRTKDFGEWLYTEELRVVPAGRSEVTIDDNLLIGERFLTINHIRTYKKDYTPIDDRFDTATTIWSYDIGMPLYDEVGSGPMTMELVAYELK